MARRAAANAAVPAVPTEATEATINEESIVTDTTVEAVEAETPAEAVEATTEATVEATEAPAEETPIDLTAFEAAVEAAIAERDESTGDVATAIAEPAIIEYRKLDGAKAKAAARKAVEVKMLEAMEESNINLARAYMQLGTALTSGPAPKAKVEKVAKAPVDPTDAFVERVAGLAITQALVGENVPEGVSEDWAEKAGIKANEVVESARALLAWTQSDAEDKGEQPEAEPFVVAAVKLALGKAAKVGGARAKSASTFTGERRNVANHIVEAFEGVEVGTFLSVAEIQKFSSKEYGDDKPSAGAVSARLKDGATAIPGIEPAQDAAGKRGAVKVAVEG